MKPVGVIKSKEQSLLYSVYNYDTHDHYFNKIIETKFKIGDRVRIPACQKS